MKKIILLLGMLFISIISFSQYSFQIIEYKELNDDVFIKTEGKIVYEKDLINLYHNDRIILSIQTDSCSNIFDDILYCQGYELILNQPMSIAIKTDIINNLIYWQFQYVTKSFIFKTNIK